MASTLPFQRRLGRTSVTVPAIGLGCMSLSPGVYGTPDETESRSVLTRALELGCTLWDSSDVYGLGHNETLIGEAIRGRPRDSVFICTKFGIDINYETGSMVVNGKPEYVRRCCKASLNRLGVDCIDLYYMHRVDPNTPIEVTVGALAELVKEGKVKYLGLSECSAETLRRAHAVHPITAVQVEYSPWTLDIEENGLLAACRELGVSVVAYSPLGRGMLTGTLTSIDDLEPGDWRRGNPRFQGENFAKNVKLAEQFKELAATKGTTPGRLCLAWILAQGPEFIVIPGTRRVKYLEDNFGAKDVKLTAEEVKQIRDWVDSVDVAGMRYDEVQIKSVNV